jgi:hypothetical protein
MRKSNIDDVIIKFKDKHGDIYDYSKFEYINTHHKSIITCYTHGDFLQTPAKHISGRGCQKCGIEKNSYSNDEIIKKINSVNSGKYKITYLDKYNKVNNSHILIECKHGNRKIPISRFLLGQGCIYCSGKKWNTIDLIEKLDNIYNGQYLYNDDFHKGKLLFPICKIHGKFKVNKDRHLSGRGCPKCSKYIKYDTIYFREVLSKKFKNLILDNCDFNGVTNYVEVECKKHGLFKTKAYYLLGGYGCKICSNEEKSYSNLEYIKKCVDKHPEIDHSLVKYTSSKSKIILVCKKHGEFSQNAAYYLNSSKGCPYCQESKGEKRIRVFLEKINEDYIQEYKIENRYFDFFLPNKNLFIEFNGKQHYQPIKFFGGDEKFQKQKESDLEKNKKINDLNSRLLVIPYWKINNVEEILNEEIYENKENI